jgi:hypothetical protein
MGKKKAIKRILKNFDFERVHNAMEALNWGWYGTGRKAPSIDQLKETAERLLTNIAYAKDYKCIAAGGFEASYVDGVLDLRFILTHWDEEVKKKKK